jgi:MoaA/NifB/PqqE/SkfB family radical SAM enzyme
MKNIEITVALRGACNYSCFYCVANNEKHKVSLLPVDKIESLCENLDAFSVTSFECGSSEPALHPQIKELIRLFLKKGVVSIPTNNSIEPDKWLPEDSKKILIRAALHPQGEQDLDGFVNRLLKIKERGADAWVMFVAHPKRWADIDRYIEFFKKYGIRVVVGGFRGNYQDKKYPEDYTPEEKEKIGLVHNTWYARLSLDITDRNFFGIPCLAGKSSIFISPEGEIKRCLYDQKEIKSVYDSSKPCTVKNCGCGLYLEELNNQGDSFWNYWKSVAGLPLIPPTGNKIKTEDELYEEKKIIYKKLINRS